MASSKPVPARRGEVASARNSARSKESERTTATACRRKARQISFEFPCAAEYVKQCGIDNWGKENGGKENRFYRPGEPVSPIGDSPMTQTPGCGRQTAVSTPAGPLRWTKIRWPDYVRPMAVLHGYDSCCDRGQT